MKLLKYPLEKNKFPKKKTQPPTYHPIFFPFSFHPNSFLENTEIQISLTQSISIKKINSIISCK